MNSPETPLFSKGRELYGLYEAREALRREDCAIVVEGYMDVVMLAQHGIEHAVATLGTATTPDHVRKLLRLVDRVVFAFDGDAAGRKAAWRALEACLPHAADTKRLDFLFLPPEHDPDTYVQAHGTSGFRKLVETALPLSEFFVRELGSRVDLESPEGRAHFLSMARPLLVCLPAAALRLQMQHRVAQLGAVSTAELNEFLAHAPAAPQAGRATRPDGVRPPPDPAAAGQGEAGRRPGRSGEPWRGGRPNGVLRSQIAPPELLRRIRLISALHPALALQPLDRDLLPEELVDWLGFLGRLPPGATTVGVLEALKYSDLPSDRLIFEQLQGDTASTQGMAAEMGYEEAQVEFSDGLRQLRMKRLALEIRLLAEQGLTSVADREQYQRLQAKMQAMRARP